MISTVVRNLGSRFSVMLWVEGAIHLTFFFLFSGSRLIGGIRPREAMGGRSGRLVAQLLPVLGPLGFWGPGVYSTVSGRCNLSLGEDGMRTGCVKGSHGLAKTPGLKNTRAGFNREVSLCHQYKLLG